MESKRERPLRHQALYAMATATCGAWMAVSSGPATSQI